MQENTWLLGIDLGTSGLKAVLVRSDGGKIFVASSGYHFDVPRAGWAEQNPEVWWRACCAATHDVLKMRGTREPVHAVSFSGQMHGLVTLDSKGRPVRPAILHCDARSALQVQKMEHELQSHPNERDALMNPAYTGFLLISLLWLRENEPENYSRVAHVMLPKDYLAYRMTGRVSTDCSDASATLAFDIAKGNWATNMLRRLEFDLALFPECFATTDIIGTMTHEALDATGLSSLNGDNSTVTIVAGGGDQVMQAIGNGAVHVGDACVNIGTSGQVSFQTAKPVRNTETKINTNTFCSFARDRWYTMGAIMNAGLPYGWFKDIFSADYAALEHEAANAKPGSVLFLPWLTGERTPYLNPNLSGAFLGLHAGTQRGDMARAVMEGVAFALRQCLDVCANLGLSARELIASGGANRSSTWLQIQSDIYNLPLRISETTEQAGLGAAIAAGVGTGVYSSLESACEQLVRYRPELIMPDATRHELYNKYYKLYREFYLNAHETIEKLTLLERG